MGLRRMGLWFLLKEGGFWQFLWWRISPLAVLRAHRNSRRHRTEILQSALCGCLFCLERFPPSQIEEWLDTEDTALCPRCGIDSVIGSESGYRITPEFLGKMHRYWFRGTREPVNGI
jgi:hypothetical protein